MCISCATAIIHLQSCLEPVMADARIPALLAVGGSFNPVHTQHVEMLVAVRRHVVALHESGETEVRACSCSVLRVSC